MFPVRTFVEALTADRMREAEAARRARDVAGGRSQPPERTRRRRLRTVASRLAFTVLR